MRCCDADIFSRTLYFLFNLYYCMLRCCSCLILNSYNVGNAEMIEQQCNRLRFQLGGSETATTCSTNEQNASLLRSQQFVVSSDNNSSQPSSRPPQKCASHNGDKIFPQEVKRRASSKVDGSDVNIRTSSDGRVSKDATKGDEFRKRKRNIEQDFPQRFIF